MRLSFGLGAVGVLEKNSGENEGMEGGVDSRVEMVARVEGKLWGKGRKQGRRQGKESGGCAYQGIKFLHDIGGDSKRGGEQS
jgi:hypothetical protein